MAGKADGEVLINSRLDTQGLNKDFAMFGDTVGKALKLLADPMTVITGGILMMGKNAIQSGIEFGSAFRGMAMSLGATEEELQTLRYEFRGLATDIPVAASELLAIGKAAGQVGVAKEDIVDFTETVAAVGSTTNMVAEEASAQFARFATIIQMPLSDVDRLGSALVDLGNNSAASGSEIMAMSMRLAAAGNQAGLSASEVVGFATALASVGIEAEAGGTAFSKLFIQMQLAVETGSAALADFASVAGQSTDEFKKAFKENAAGAVQTFIKGLSDVDRTGKSAIQTLDEIGISEVRMRDALLRAASAGDLMTDSIARANKAWDDNTALSDAIELKYTSMGSQLTLLKNSMQEVSLTVYDNLRPALEAAVTVANDILHAFIGLPPGMKDFAATALLVAGGILTVKKGIEAATTVKSIYLAVTKATAAGELEDATAKGVNTAATGALTTATKGLTAAMAANPMFVIGGAALAIAGIITGIKALSDSYENNTEKLSRLNDEYQRTQDTINETADELEKVQQRIRELSDLKAPTLADEKELDNLRFINRELEAQLVLQQRLAESTAAEKQAALMDVLAERYATTRQEITDINFKYTSLIDSYMTLDERVEYHITKIQEFKTKCTELREQQIALIETGEENSKTYKNNAKEIEKLTGSIGVMEETLLSDVKQLREYRDQLDVSTEAGQAMAEMLDGVLGAFTEFIAETSEGTEVTSDFNSELDVSAEILGEVTASARTLSEQIDELSDAFDENGKAVELTDKQLLDIIEAGRASELVFDAETGAVYLNTDAMIANAEAKLYELESTLNAQKMDLVRKMNQERIAAEESVPAILDYAEAKLVATAAEKDMIDQLDASTALIEQLRERLTKVGTAATSDKRSGSGARAKEAREEVSEILKSEMELLKRKKDLREIDAREYKESLDVMLQNTNLNSKERAELEKALHSAKVDLMKETEKAQKTALESAYSAEKDNVDRVKDLLKDQEYASREIMTDGSTEKLDIISREYLERIRWIEDENSIYSTAVNDQMRLEFDRSREVLLNKESELDAELEILSITNQGLYEQIMNLRERNDTIREGQRLRQEEAQEERDREREQKLLADIAKEEDEDRRQSLYEQLETLYKERAEKELIKAENAAIEANNKQILELTTKINENTTTAKEKVKEYNDEVKETVSLMTEALEKGQAGAFTFGINAEGIKEGLAEAISQLENTGGEMLIQMSLDKGSIDRMLGETKDTIKAQQKPIGDEMQSLSNTTYNLINDFNRQMYAKLMADIKQMFAYMVDEMQRGIAQLRALQQEAESIMSSVGGMAGAASNVVMNFYNVEDEETAYKAARELQRVNALGGAFN